VSLSESVIQSKKKSTLVKDFLNKFEYNEKMKELMILSLQLSISL